MGITHTQPLWDAIVVGGGSVGAATALGLAQQGWSVVLVERRTQPVFTPEAPITRVTTLNAAAIALLERLEVWPQIQERRSHAFTGMEVWDAQSPASIRFTADDLGVTALGWTVELLALESSLWEALARYPQCQIRATSAWRALDYYPEHIALHLEDGSQLHGRLLLAADGAESPLRQAAGIGLQQRPYHASGIVATVHTEYAHEDTAWQRFADDDILAFLPLAGGQCSIVWSRPTVLAETTAALDDAAFQETLTEAFEHRLGAITHTSPRYVFPLVGRQAKHYGRDRLLLLGDAAHTIHPLAGQGLNLGLADVRHLLDLTEAYGTQPPDYPELLRAYTQGRRLDNEVIRRAMEGLRGLFAAQNPLLRGLRGLGVSWVDHSGWLKQQLARKALGV